MKTLLRCFPLAAIAPGIDDMADTPAGDCDDIVSDLAIRKAAAPGEEHSSSSADAPLRFGGDGHHCCIRVSTGFNLDKGDQLAPPRDNIDFSAGRFFAHGED